MTANLGGSREGTATARVSVLVFDGVLNNRHLVSKLRVFRKRGGVRILGEGCMRLSSVVLEKILVALGLALNSVMSKPGDKLMHK